VILHRTAAYNLERLPPDSKAFVLQLRTNEVSNDSRFRPVVSRVARCRAERFCDTNPGSDRIQAAQQETILAEGTRAVGMPAIKNFQERKLLKDILELRDQTNLATYTYVWSEMKGRGTFLCDSLGFGLPYADAVHEPAERQLLRDKFRRRTWRCRRLIRMGSFRQPQPKERGSCASTAKGKDISPIYVEPRIIVSTFQAGDRVERSLGRWRASQPTFGEAHSTKGNDRATHAAVPLFFVAT